MFLDGSERGSRALRNPKELVRIEAAKLNLYLPALVEPWIFCCRRFGLRP